MTRYEPAEIEAKWQKIWNDEHTFAATDDYTKPKFYALVEFPYPSGQGLHVGHPRSYTALDIVARKRRLQGYNVLYPMGWDAFGLPTENFAMKNHIHPEIVTKNNVARFKSQLQMLGLSFDWDREINTTDPAYYKWTQWIFIQMFKITVIFIPAFIKLRLSKIKIIIINAFFIKKVFQPIIFDKIFFSIAYHIKYRMRSMDHNQFYVILLTKLNDLAKETIRILLLTIIISCFGILITDFIKVYRSLVITETSSNILSLLIVYHFIIICSLAG